MPVPCMIYLDPELVTTVILCISRTMVRLFPSHNRNRARRPSPVLAKVPPPEGLACVTPPFIDCNMGTL